MTKLNLINKHWLHVQCSNCRHDKNVPVQQFIDRGINDIQQIKAKSRCSHCGHRGEPDIVIYYRNEYDVEHEKNAALVRYYRDDNWSIGRAANAY